MELGHLLTRSGLTCPEASSKPWFLLPVGSSVSLPWVIYYEAFCDSNNEPFNVRLGAVYGRVILQMTPASGTTIFKVPHPGQWMELKLQPSAEYSLYFSNTSWRGRHVERNGHLIRKSCISCDLNKYSQTLIKCYPDIAFIKVYRAPNCGERSGAISERSIFIHLIPVTRNVHISGKTVDMRRITTFRSATDRIYDGGPITYNILYYITF
jgi:hypothetical protein